MDDILNLTAEQILLLSELVPVAKEAKEASRLVHEAYHNAFGIGEDKIKIWGDSNNNEYLTHSGVWQARYLHESYDVKCTPEEFYKYFRAEFLIQNGYAKETEDGQWTEEGKLKLIAGHLRAFIEKAKSKLESKD